MTGYPLCRADAKRRRAALLPCCSIALMIALAALPNAVADGDALAVVNGDPITRAAVVDLVMKAHGLEALQQLIVLELAKQETRRRNLKVTEADVDTEFRESLNKISPGFSADGLTMSDAEKRQALDFVLEQKGLSMAEFRVGMRRNAHLRKVVEHDFQIDEGTLREEFDRIHGARVVVRHIQVGDRDLNTAFTRLHAGEEFAEVARELSQNPDTAAQGGEMPPFGFRDDSVPAALREVAFALDPGEVSSAVRLGKWNHILKLERRLAPEGVRFEDVRADVERGLRERAVPQEMQRLATELFQQANIRVLDRELKRQYEDLLKRNTAGG